MTSAESVHEVSRNRAQEREVMGTYATSFGISLGLTSLFNALLVIIKEMNESTVLAWMNAAGHHWVTQGVLDLFVFVVLGYALARMGEKGQFSPNPVIATAVGGVVVGALIIAGFFLM